MTGALRLAAAGADLEARRVTGAGNGEPALVLLHEGLGCVAMWRDFPERLAGRTGCDVLAYSRAGYGGSSACALPRPLDYMDREALEVLPAVLDAAVPGPCVLVGHSDGATIAAIHAGRARDPRVIGAVLMAPHFFAEPVTLAAIRRARETWEAGALRPALERHHGANVDAAFLGWNDAWLDPGFADWDVRDAVADATVPLLVVQGEDDPYGTTAQVEAARAAPGRVETLLLPGCGHAPHQERTARVLEAIAGFVAGLRDAG